MSMYLDEWVQQLMGGVYFDAYRRLVRQVHRIWILENARHINNRCCHSINSTACYYIDSYSHLRVERSVLNWKRDNRQML